MGKQSRLKKERRVLELKNDIYSTIQVKNPSMAKQIHNMCENIIYEFGTLNNYKTRIKKIQKKLYNTEDNISLESFKEDFNVLTKLYIKSEIMLGSKDKVVTLFRTMGEDIEYYQKNNQLQYLYSNPNSQMGRANDETNQILYVSNCPAISIAESKVDVNADFSLIKYSLESKMSIMYLGIFESTTSGILKDINDTWKMLLENNQKKSYYNISNYVIKYVQQKSGIEYDGIAWVSQYAEQCNVESCKKLNLAIKCSSERKLTPISVSICNKEQYSITIDQSDNIFNLTTY